MFAAVAAGLVALATTRCASQRERPSAATEFECVAAPEDGTQVHVVDEQRRPVAGAFVTWFERLDGIAADLAPEPELTRLRCTLGTTVRTNADGRTRVGNHVGLVASSGGAYAATRVAQRRFPIYLVLQPARSITVTTVDRDAQAIGGVPLSLHSRSRDGASTFEWRVETDEHGVATIGPLDLFASGSQDTERDFSVKVDALLRNPLEPRFVARQIPDAPLRFELPPTGRLAIDVVDDTGRAAESIAGTTIRTAPADGVEVHDDDVRKRELWSEYDGRARHDFPRVEVGQEFEVYVDRNTGDLDVTARVVGPKSPGETVTARLVGVRLPRLAARIVDARGEPVADRRVEIHVSSYKHRVHPWPLGAATTDRDGRLEVSIESFDDWREAIQGQCWITAACRDEKSQRIEAVGFVLLPRTDVPERPAAARLDRDAGVVQVQSGPRVAAGIVVDDRGAPVTGAQIAVTTRDWEMEELEGTPDEPDVNVVLGSTVPQASSLLSTATDTDGRFEMIGDTPSAALLLHVEKTGFRVIQPTDSGADVPFETGAADLHIRLQRFGTVAGRVLATPKDLRELELRIRSDISPYETFVRPLDADGDFEVSAPAGSYRFQIRPAGEGVMDIGTFALWPGIVTTVPDVDLRGLRAQH
jgi:hypothetical protein